MRKSLAIVACLAVVGLVGAAQAEQVDNPAYAAWSKSKVGATVTYKMLSESKAPGMDQAMKTEATLTQTLKEIKPESVTVEVTTKMTMNGQEMSMPARSQVIPAKVEKGKEYTTGVQGEVSDMKVGKETVEVNGKKYDAETREFTMKMTEPAAMTAQTKVWTTADVPGGMLKSETKTITPMESMTTITLVEVGQKKD